MEAFIGRDQHVFIAGKTGTGKSYLAERYLATEPHVVMLDTKGETLMRIKKKQPLWVGVKDDDIDVCYSLDELEEAQKEKIIYVPDPREMNQESYEDFFSWIYRRQNCIVWIDELTSVCPSPHKMPLSLLDIYARGRSRETTVWACTQRPVGIPSMCISQSTHVFCFRLNKKADRQRLVDDTGMTEFETPPSGHDFWYYRDGAEEAIQARLVES